MKALAGIFLDSDSPFSLQGQISWQLKEHIQSGTLKPGEALPSTRELATQLKVSRNTVVYAYDRLMSDGYLEPRSRLGIFVSTCLVLPQQRPQAPKPRPADAVIDGTPTPKSLGPPAPFRPCQPDVTLFPLLVWNRLRGRALRTSGSSLLHYQASCNPGLPALRRNLAAYLRDSRGVRCDWRQIIITSGSQQALYILSNLLVRSAEPVYMEDPGYVEARLAWQNAGAKIESAPIDDEGLKLPATVKRFSLIYTTPSRQFPTGASLSLRRRRELIDLMVRTKTWVIEDDYDSELRYSAPPIPSLQSLDRSGRGIYVGTFSKLLFPSLRLGYVVVPEPLLDRFQWVKHLIDDHLPLIDQATLALFLESGAFYSHIRRCRRAYAERQSLLLKLVRDSGLPLEFKYTDGGMNLTGFLPAGTDDKKCAARLKEAGLDIPPLSQYALRKVQPGLVLGFTAFDTATIRIAFERMLKVLRPILS